MSLISYASTWISDNPEQQTQKRIPTMRKTIKKMPPQPVAPTQQDNQEIGIGGPSAYQSTAEIYSTPFVNGDDRVDQPSPIQITVDDQEKRQSRVNELLKQMNSVQIENDGQHLANFKPLSHPVVNITKKMDSIPSTTSEEFQPLPPMFRNTPSDPSRPTFSANQGNLDKIAGYHQAYEVPRNTAAWIRGEATGTAVVPGQSDKLMDKINYMIYLLESQQNEKTHNSMEEFVMFSLVGIFIIYVLDSFTRSARYTR